MQEKSDVFVKTGTPGGITQASIPSRMNAVKINSGNEHGQIHKKNGFGTVLVNTELNPDNSLEISLHNTGQIAKTAP